MPGKCDGASSRALGAGRPHGEQIVAAPACTRLQVECSVRPLHVLFTPDSNSMDYDTLGQVFNAKMQTISIGVYMLFF